MPCATTAALHGRRFWVRETSTRRRASGRFISSRSSSKLVLGAELAFARRAVGDPLPGVLQRGLGRAEQAGSLGRSILRELGAGGAGQREAVEVERIRGSALLAGGAHVGCRAAELAKLRERRGFRLVRSLAQHFHGARHPCSGLLRRHVRFRAARRKQADRERAGERPRAREPRAHSLVFGGGPIWIRSPMYEPISVNTTPSKDMSAYMNAGIVFTVCEACRRNAVGIATKNTATIGSMKVRPGDTKPISMPPKNQT